MVKEAESLNYREIQVRHDLAGRERVLIARKPL